MLFVPLTTITMSRIPKEKMGNAASMFNLLRNIGGSVGIAGVTTMVARFAQSNTADLVHQITPYNQKAMGLMRGMQQSMMAHGSAPNVAYRQSYAQMFGLVQQQATILSFLEIFRILSVIFLALVPLVLIMKRPGKMAGPVAAH